MNADGEFCGVTPGLEAYPLLWWQNIDNFNYLPYGVCISSCPTATQTQVPCSPTTNVNAAGGDYVGGMCIPKPGPYSTINFLNRYCVPNVADLIGSQADLYNNMLLGLGLDDLNQWIEDILNCPNLYLVAVGSAVFLIWFWNLMLRNFAEALAWVSIFVVGVGLLIAGFLVRNYSINNYPEGTKTQKWLNIASWVIWGATAIYVLAILCCWYSIKIAIKVLRVAARVIMNNLKMVLIPMLMICVTVVWIAGSIYCFMWILSCGELTVEQVPIIGLSYTKYVYTKEEKNFLYAAAFFFFWVTAFLIAVADYVLIICVCQWYFTENTDKRGNFSINLGFRWAFRYNAGSLLFGSFIIAVVWSIRIIFEYIERKIQANNGQMHPTMAWVLKGIRCCLDCCHRFIKYVNKNAYCQVALTGENFCTAAVNGFLLILKHSMTFAFTAGLGGFFNIIGKATCSVMNVIAAFLILQYYPEIHSGISSPVGPMIVVFLITFIIASMFMAMYTTTATCLLHCLFADVDICKSMGYDEMQGQNRPPEMRSIVRCLSKVKKEKVSSNKIN